MPTRIPEEPFFDIVVPAIELAPIALLSKAGVPYCYLPVHVKDMNSLWRALKCA